MKKNRSLRMIASLLVLWLSALGFAQSGNPRGAAAGKAEEGRPSVGGVSDTMPGAAAVTSSPLGEIWIGEALNSATHLLSGIKMSPAGARYETDLIRRRNQAIQAITGNSTVTTEPTATSSPTGWHKSALPVVSGLGAMGPLIPSLPTSSSETRAAPPVTVQQPHAQLETSPASADRGQIESLERRIRRLEDLLGVK